MSQRGGKLQDIREKIDAMDAQIHALLMQRGALIAELQQAKGVGGPAGTSAMRPAREAQMMRALAARHDGDFPLAATERIWREIIASFTQMQAPFRVVLTGADDPTLMETGRFYFGVTTSLRIVRDADQVLEQIAAHDDVAGVIMGELDNGNDWWARLAAAPDHPARIVARIPFFSGYSADAAWRRTAYQLSRAAFEPSGIDKTLIVACTRQGVGTKAVAALFSMHPARILAKAEIAGTNYTLVEADGYLQSGSIQDREDVALRWIGGYGISSK